MSGVEVATQEDEIAVTEEMLTEILAGSSLTSTRNLRIMNPQGEVYSVLEGGILSSVQQAAQTRQITLKAEDSKYGTETATDKQID